MFWQGFLAAYLFLALLCFCLLLAFDIGDEEF